MAELEAALAEPKRRKVVYLPGVVEACLRDLKGTVDTDPDYARGLLAKLVGDITLRRKGDHLWAETRGNLAGIVELAAEVVNGGAGRGI
ncbi:MAG TPA: hypothetical protein VFP86_16140 [bacterium]|nr:hypothetical protein [bacterium]